MELIFKEKKSGVKSGTQAFRCQINARKPWQTAWQRDKKRPWMELVGVVEPGLKTVVEIETGLRPWSSDQEAGYIYHIYVNTCAGQYGKTWQKTDFVKAHGADEAADQVKLLAKDYLKECLAKDLAYLKDTLDMLE